MVRAMLREAIIMAEGGATAPKQQREAGHGQHP